MRIQAVDKAQVRSWWDFIRPGVCEIRETCKEPWIPEDVYAHLKFGHATLFAFFVGEAPKGFAIVEICDDPNTGKYINVWMMHFVQLVEDCREEILAWLDHLCRSSGANRCRFGSPRAARAWIRILRGDFEERLVIYERVVR